MIDIEVRTKTDVAERDIRQFAERRIGFALDNLRDLRRIAVSIDDVNGPKGGPDKRCRIIAEFGFASIITEETETDWQMSLARAIHKVARKASERLQRVNRGSAQNARRPGGRSFRIRTHSGPASKHNENLRGAA